MKLALFGEHIEQSLSPKIYQALAKQFSCELEYQLIPVTAENFKEKWQQFIKNGGTGANVTTPCKQHAYQLCTTLSPAAQQAESVNTLRIDDENNIYGDNTDGEGFIQDFVVNLQHTLTNKTILLLGAGGAACGIVPAIIAHHPQSIYIANRTVENAEKIAQKYKNVHAHALTQIPKIPFDIIINTSCELPLADLSITLNPNAIAYDIRYKSGDQDFLNWSKSQNAASIHNGLGMLKSQANLSFHIFQNI